MCFLGPHMGALQCALQCTVSSCTLTSCGPLLQGKTQAAQKEVAAAQRARDETANVLRQLKTSSERNVAQQGKLVQLQAEVEQLQQQLQEIQVSVMLSACVIQVCSAAAG